MERVAFLIEKTGESISCLLNPESLVARRRAGISSVRAATGAITGFGLSDDPVAGTGGGVTEYDLDLLFDVDLASEEAAAAAQPVAPFEVARAAPSAGTGAAGPGAADSGAAEPPALSGAAGGAEPDAEDLGAAGETLLVPVRRVSRDVRELTRPFWALSENAQGYGQGNGLGNGQGGDGYGAPPVVRMIWGRAWNVLGVVVAAAERLERFSDSGVPGRSWLRLRLRRIAETPSARSTVPEPVTPQFELPPSDAAAGSEGTAVAVTVAPDGLPIDRLDQIAADVYGDPGAWRLIALANDIDDPLNLGEGTVLQLPPGAGSS